MNLVCAGSFGNIVLVASGRCGTDALPLKLFLPCAQLSGGWSEFLENYSTKMHITLQVRSGQVRYVEGEPGQGVRVGMFDAKAIERGVIVGGGEAGEGKVVGRREW